MKIADAEIFIVGNPPPGFGGRYFIFVKLTTDGGVCGFGEGYGIPFHPSAAKAMLEDFCGRNVVGCDPFQIERLLRIGYADNYAGRPDLSLAAAISAAETACWDIIGKELNKPIYALLGGKIREKLRGYTYLYPTENLPNVYGDPHQAAEKAAECVKRGFTAVKFDPVGPYTAFDPRQLSLESLLRAEEFAKLIREAVGGKCDLLIGTHGQMTPASAIRLARRLEKFDPLWLEEPTPPDNPQAMAKVAHATSIPIAAGERLAMKSEFASLLNCDAAAILQMNLGRVGGILEGKKIAALAESHHAQIAPHLYNGPIAGAAAIQLAACSPNFLIQEGIEEWGGFHADLLKSPIRFEDGYIIPPTAPGLGVELNEKIALANPYDGDELHLQPHKEPL